MHAPLFASGPSAAPSSVRERRRPRLNPTALWVSLAVLAFHAVVAAWALWPTRVVDERLATAGRTHERGEREALLGRLGTHPGADLGHLLRAAALLQEVDGFVGLQRLAHDAGRRYPRELDFPLLEARSAIALHMSDEALTALGRAAQLAPSDVRVPLLRATVFEKDQQLEEALEALDDAFQLAPETPGVALRYGRMLSAEGRLEEAAEVLNQVRAPEDVGPARAELAFLHYRGGRWEQARALLEWTVQHSPEVALAHHLLGAVRFRLGDAEGAAKAWRDADRLEPDEPRHLAALCELTGRPPHSGREARAVANLFRRRFPIRASRIGGACFTPSTPRR